MKIKAEQLSAQLKKHLAPVYIVSGDEILLRNEACQQIKDAATVHAYDECQRLIVEPRFDWQVLSELSNSYSLFAEKTLIDLQLGDAKPGDKGAKALIAYTENLPDDKILLIRCSKLASPSLRSKWYKALDAVGVCVQIWPVNAKQLPHWINQRLNALGLQASAEAVSLIAERVEGNLLAANQEIEKLHLQFKQGPLSLKDIEQSIGFSSRFDVFKLNDYALSRQAKKTLHALSGLHEEGTEALKILWALTRELRLLAELASTQESGGSFSEHCRKLAIWDSRKPLVQLALKGRSSRFFLRLLQKAQQIDEIIKGERLGDSWQALTIIYLALAGVRV